MKQNDKIIRCKYCNTNTRISNELDIATAKCSSCGAFLEESYITESNTNEKREAKANAKQAKVNAKRETRDNSNKLKKPQFIIATICLALAILWLAYCDVFYFKYFFNRLNDINSFDNLGVLLFILYTPLTYIPLITATVLFGKARHSLSESIAKAAHLLKKITIVLLILIPIQYLSIFLIQYL